MLLWIVYARALASTKDVGIYDQALKLSSIFCPLVTSLGSVMLSRVVIPYRLEITRLTKQMHQMSFLNIVVFSYNSRDVNC